MSSPPMVGSGSTTFSSPTTRAAARRARSATAASLTTAGFPGRTSTSARQRRRVGDAGGDAPRSAPACERRSSGSKVRMVPVSVTSSGITLKACPPWMAPMVTTAESSGETSRATTVCRATTTWAAATTGSAARCGWPPWPPRPRTTMRSRSTAAMSGPAFTPMRADGQLVPEVDAQDHVHALEGPVRDHALGSALAFLGGLEEDAHAARPAAARPRTRAAAAPIAVWPSWPQACITPGTREA